MTRASWWQYNFFTYQYPECHTKNKEKRKENFKAYDLSLSKFPEVWLVVEKMITSVRENIPDQCQTNAVNAQNVVISWM